MSKETFWRGFARRCAETGRDGVGTARLFYAAALAGLEPADPDEKRADNTILSILSNYLKLLLFPSLLAGGAGYVYGYGKQRRRLAEQLPTPEDLRALDTAIWRHVMAARLNAERERRQRRREDWANRELLRRGVIAGQSNGSSWEDELAKSLGG